MMKTLKKIAAVTAVAAMMGSVWVCGADGEDVIKNVMKKYHKAPKGTDNTSQKAAKGAATPQEIKDLIAGYKAMCTAKPPAGDDASWKAKTTALLAAAQGLEKGGADAQAKYKDAVNCKACHSVHKGQ
jgi:cytochrome c2